MRVKKGDNVRVHYQGRLTDGTTFDSSVGREPIQYVTGDGLVIPGFEEAVLSMELGEKKTITIPAAQAYGEANKDMIIDFPKSEFPNDLEVEIGMRLNMTNSEGHVIPVIIGDISGDTVKLDANHPLAGKDLVFDLELIQINKTVATTIFEKESEIIQDPKSIITLSDINEELIKYLQKRPNYIYDLNPRKFEELVAHILKSFGFDVELTPATRDGGKDILAHIKTNLISLLIFVECKRYKPDHPVGVDIVRGVIGVQEIYKANKSMIVTTSSFTKDAVRERDIVSHKLELKDNQDVNSWITNYKKS